MAIQYPGNIISATERSTSSSSASGMWSLPAHIQKQKAGTWPATTLAIQTDTYFPQTSLLLHGDGTNGANNTVFVDSSTNSLTVTTNGKPLQGTSSPFSQTGWSNYFDGTGDYITVGANAAFAVGTGDFTIETWIIFNAFPGSGAISSIMESQALAGSAAADKFWFGLFNNSGTYRLQMGQHNTGSAVYANWTPSLGRWYHVALTRSSGTVYFFVDGVSLSTTNSTLFNGTSFGQNGFTIGAISTPYYLNGYISNFRYIKGTALYTSSFTPSTTPLTAVSGTQLLTCQDNRFKDNSTNGFTLTLYGDVSVQPFSPLSPNTAYSSTTIGGSMYTANSGYLTLPSSTSSLYLTGAFTWEAWVYPMGNTGQMLYGHWVSNFGTANRWAFFYTPSGWNTFKLYWYRGNYGSNETAIGTTAGLTKNSWNHVAFVRDGSNNIYIFVNGVSQTLSTFSSGLAWDNGYSFTAGDANGIGGNSEYRFDGYMSGVKFVQGIANYTSNFTPPTAPPTATSNTQLLVNFTNARIIDQTAKNNLVTAAGANISTTQSKYGGSSISFNGTSGYLQLLNTGFNNIPASTDFTLECWVNTPASSTAPTVWHNTSSSKIVAFYLGSSDANNLDTIMGTFSYPSPNVSVVRGTIDVVANTWTHIAFVRSGSTITVYVGGTACGTGTSSYASNPLQLIGAISTGATTPDFYFFPGYIDDLRLTIGVARYSSNFTPSTTAFADR